MTELMKRFQEETGVDLFGGWTYEIVNGLMTPPFNESPWMKFNEWLAEQLTWRPASEKPEKEGWYLCKTQYADDTFGVETVFFNGKNFIYSRVIAWLPIPPSY
jgi:hypothetical protein